MTKLADEVLPLLRGAAAFSRVPDTELRAVVEHIEIMDLPTGAFIVSEGDPGDAWYVVGQGSAEVVTYDLVGQSTLLGGLATGDSFGEVSLIRAGVRTATVRALEDVHLFVLRRNVFLRLVATCPAFADQIRACVDLLEVDAFLCRASPLARLPRGIVRELAGSLERLRVAPGEIVVREGEAGDRFFLVRSGRVEIIKGGHLVGQLGMGDCFGEVGLLATERRIATVRAIEDTELLALTRAAFEAIVGEHSEARGLLAELARIRHSVASLGRPTLADPRRTLAPIVALDRRRTAWMVLLGGVAAFAALSQLTIRTATPGLTVATVLVGSLVGPLAFTAWLAEANILAHRARTLAATFGLAAVVGLPLAVIAERSLGVIPGGLGAGLVGALIEEPLKLVGVVWLLRRSSSRFAIDGAIYGAAAGMGFAAFESILYGLGRADDTTHLLGTLWARTLLAPFGHGTWTAIICAAIWQLKANGVRRWGLLQVGGALAFSIGLHAAWDWQLLPGTLLFVWLLGVGVVGLAALATVVRWATGEEAEAILALNPELAHIDPTTAPSVRAHCRTCGQAAPRGAHYCPRCGRALIIAPHPE